MERYQYPRIKLKLLLLPLVLILSPILPLRVIPMRLLTLINIGEDCCGIFSCSKMKSHRSLRDLHCGQSDESG
ncbi:hypothetical protein PF005_g5573 [Phytophthora fragariae]|uniref:Uncharacterized protein n=1 Tax=Phytophthora fragariae TaxID=53985 RepID=A0A6A3YXK8_9STRA|nr:hypothetical protein PF003_g2390 [Phytophthora fragariae]KAE8944252.1 hypothetical protein PF009_g6077 [Phytophthora fragariae]KAE9127397.1 hypothetical protein PF007_g5631 [Phytophthora fragariae]KAE9150915.1 hypothetical protein PF006_g4748 [Phytophthora fragariae]KAE9225305.1 hypothetical protein PF005_g5573 [Phytophthora fragariae]